MIVISDAGLCVFSGLVKSGICPQGRGCAVLASFNFRQFILSAKTVLLHASGCRDISVRCVGKATTIGLCGWEKILHFNARSNLKWLRATCRLLCNITRGTNLAQSRQEFGRVSYCLLVNTWTVGVCGGFCRRLPL